jgi:hypothetical protein
LGQMMHGRKKEMKIMGNKFMITHFAYVH